MAGVVAGWRHRPSGDPSLAPTEPVNQLVRRLEANLNLSSLSPLTGSGLTPGMGNYSKSRLMAQMLSAVLSPHPRLQG